MPNTKSAEKRVRTAGRKHDRNMAAKGRMRTARTKLVQAIENGDREQSLKRYREYCSIVDKAGKKCVITANAVNRRKSRAAKKLATAA